MLSNINSIYKEENNILDNYIRINNHNPNTNSLIKKLQYIILLHNNGKLNPRESFYVTQPEFNNLFLMVDKPKDLILIARSLGLNVDKEAELIQESDNPYSEKLYGLLGIELLRRILKHKFFNSPAGLQYSNLIFKNKGCNFITSSMSNRWGKIHNRIINNNIDSCSFTQELQNSFQRVLANIPQNKNIIFLFHYGDAVKNNMNVNDQDANKYNIFTKYFIDMNYDDKVFFMDSTNFGNPYMDYINMDFRQWSRQQWPRNTIEYAKMTNSHLIYIQSDSNYCLFPSMYAEAMCGTLYTKFEYIEKSSFHFSGVDQDLYCVSDYSIAYKLKDMAIQHQRSNINKIKILSEIPGDIEWINFSPTFMKNFYEYLSNLELQNVSRTNNIFIDKYDWLKYPWEILMDVKQSDIKPVTLTLLSMGNLGGNIYNNITYVGDIPINNVNILLDDNKINIKWSKIPLRPFMKSDNGTAVMMGSLYNSPVPSYVIHPNLIFDGSFENPVIKTINTDKILNSDKINIYRIF